MTGLKTFVMRFASVMLLACLAGWFVPAARAQSLPETVESIHKARITTRVLFITAHPDDEWSSLLAYLSHGLDADVALLTITRGQGGQNAIGPEQGGELGVIRTEELLAAGSHYGVRQFFTRAQDTGYVKSPEQAMKVWDGLALEDMVRVIRTYRPDVVINGWGGVHSGHGHHQASGILTPQAVVAAADPKMYPEQIAEGLAPWKARLDLRLAREQSAEAVELPVNAMSALWGKSYVEIGMEGHAQHRSQGTPAFFGNPFFRRPIFLVNENAKDSGKFDAKLLAEPLPLLADRFGALKSAMAPALTAADENLTAAGKSIEQVDRPAAARSLAAAGKTIQSLREQISKQRGSEAKDAGWELARVSERIDLALANDVAIPIETQADRHELVAGENFTVEVTSGSAAVPTEYTLDASSLLVPAGWTVTPEEGKASKDDAKFKVAIPAGAQAPGSPGDRILPFAPALVQLNLKVTVDGYAFRITRAIDSVEASTTGILTYPLQLVPLVTLTVDPKQMMMPQSKAGTPLNLLARVRYHGEKAVKVEIGADEPEGWRLETPKLTGPLEFSGAGDQLVQFVVQPPSGVAAGAYMLKPYARVGSETFRTSLAPIPTLPTRNWSEPADATVHVLNLTVPAGLHIGYIAADNDTLPEILRQIGIQVDLLDDVTLAFGELDQYDAITVGIRAYELRPDLIRSNSRLLDYVKRGGTLLVQYQRDFAWNKELPAPYPATMPDSTSRVTDANSPVRFLAPDNPLLNSPNKITQADFEGWVQERGLYFWGTFDSKYTPVLGLKDPGEAEANGALLYAQDGKGIYIYTGLSFFRELPAGVPGAYRLFVNLLSQTQRGH
ncbi:MAG TPA: PIG-L family deacetylase [Candidatus Acidoferrales bacterium]